MTNSKPPSSPREAIADFFSKHLSAPESDAVRLTIGLGAADKLLEALRSRGFAIVPTDIAEFYAKPENYVTRSTGFAVQYDPEPPEVHWDRGAKMRDALRLIGA